MSPEHQDRVRVWDIVVRLFHWSLVVAFVLCYLTGDELDEVHAYLGYAILVLLGIRIVWGMVGTKHARFADFIYGWGPVRAYLLGLMVGRPPHYLGHNPLGGWMVVLLLASLLLASWTGLEAYGQEGYGPLAGSAVATALARDDNDKEEEKENEKEDGEGDELWEELHEVSVNLSLTLVILHIFGVIVSSVLHRENLVRAMWTGYKVKRESDAA